MKFSSRTTKSALVSALLLGSGVIAMTAAQDDGTQLDPVVPLDDDVDDVPVLGSSGDCGFLNDGKNGQTCTVDDDHIMIGVWLCEEGVYDDADHVDMSACGCEDYKVSSTHIFPIHLIHRVIRLRF